MAKLIKFSTFLAESEAKPTVKPKVKSKPEPVRTESTIELSMDEISDMFYAAHVAFKDKKKNVTLHTIESEEGHKVHIKLRK